MSKPLKPPTLPRTSHYSSEASVEEKQVKSGSPSETPTRIYKQWPPPSPSKPDNSTEKSVEKKPIKCDSPDQTPTRIYKQWPPPELTKPDSSTDKSAPETPTRTSKQWPPPSPSKPDYSTEKSVEKKPFKCVSQPETPTKAAKQPVLPPSVQKKSSYSSEKSVEEQQRRWSLPLEAPTSPTRNTCYRNPGLPKSRSTLRIPNEDDARSLYEYILQEESSLSLFCTELTPWKELCKNLEARNATEQEIIQVKAEHMYRVYQRYDALMNAHQEDLQECIDELHRIVLNLDKVSKGTKVAGITGGTAAALGGVAAAAGVILSPVTMGASLAVSAVGVGVAAAGGVTGASAAIAHKANLKSDTKKIKLILQQFRDRYEKFLPCLKLIFDGMDQLKLHGKSTLSETKVKSEKTEQMLKMVTEDTSALAAGKSSKICGMIAGFALGMDFYFTQDGDEQKIKKELRSKFAHKIRKLTEDLKQGLDELTGIHDFLSQYQ